MVIIHLQSSNKKYYAIKQLWYKHHEFVKYDHDVQFINGRYDPVVNGLNFNPQFTPQNIIDGIDIDLSFFNGLEGEKGYVDFIKEHYNEELITFGKEYITWRLTIAITTFSKRFDYVSNSNTSNTISFLMHQ
jgi:hypothetical protein